MPFCSPETINIRCEADIVVVRQRVKELSVKLGLKLVEQTKLVTAASEIARNTLVHGKGGQGTFEIVDAQSLGIKLIFEDQGPGIENIEQALRDGYSSGKGMGLGLGGAKRLVDEFNIQSEVNQGTVITLIKWKR